MANLSTEMEFLAAEQAAMGPELGSMHFALRKDLVWLQIKWAEFRELFGNNQKRFTLMNATAPAFFARLESVLWNDILLHLCRLTDPPTMAGKTNLSLAQLPALVSDADVRPRVEELLSRAVEKTAFARDWRNRHIAHHDLKRAQDPDLYPLASASRADVEQALHTIRELMNALELRYQGMTTGYEHSSSAPGEGSALLWYLSSGLAAEHERRQKGIRWQPSDL